MKAIFSSSEHLVSLRSAWIPLTLSCLVVGGLGPGCSKPRKAPEPVVPAATRADKQETEAGYQTVTITQGDVRRTVKLKTEPIVDGCSMEGAVKVLSTRRELVRECAKEMASRVGRVPEGRVVLALSLDKSGNPAQIALSLDEVGDEAFGSCLKGAVNIRFPNPYGRVCIVQAPFQFRGKSEVLVD